MTDSRQALVVVIALNLASVAGNRATAAEAVTVSGVVTVDGQRLVDGEILFYHAGGEFVGAKIKGGAFRLTRVPPGDCRVAIRGGPVSRKYATDETSPLTASIKTGVNAFDFDLRK